MTLELPMTNSGLSDGSDEVHPKIHREIVANLINTFVPHGIGVEIGVKKAATSSVILKKTSTKHIYLIDPWRHRQEWMRVSKIMQGFPGRATIVRKKSEDATQDVPNELDFVWIDGNHNYDFVMKDLILWVPKVYSGGLILGHDWGKRFPDVERAVVDYAELHPFAPLTKDYEDLGHIHSPAPETKSVVNVSEHGNVWWVLKSILIFCLLSVSVLAQEWQQISGPIQTSQFIAPSISQLDEITIRYKQEVNGLADEHFVTITFINSEMTVEPFYTTHMECTTDWMVGVCLSDEWRQVSGPNITLQTSQIKISQFFIVPTIDQLDEILISYRQLGDDKFGEDFISIPLLSNDVP